MCRILYIIFFSFFLISCKETRKERLLRLMQKWDGREIIYSPDMNFAIQGLDTLCLDSIQYKYKIVTYIDSVGCMSCKLNLAKWQNFVTVVDSIFPHTVFFQFVFQPYKLNELMLNLKREKFRCPVCIDMKDQFNKLNKFPKEIEFNTFLLDENNRVLAIGNPTHNSKIKELYLRILGNKEIDIDKNKNIKTEVVVDNLLISLGTFDYESQQLCVFKLDNKGNEPLVIEDISTSCGCISVEYSKEPIRPGKTGQLKVIYKATRPEYFIKEIIVYCNAKDSPIVLKVEGNAIL